DGKRFATARGYGDIDVHRIGGDAVNGTALAPETAADQTDVRGVVVGDLRNVPLFYFLIAGRGHFLRGGKIGPQLKAVHAAGVIALGHFLVDDAAARGHPLVVTGGDGAAIADAIAVLDGSGENIGNGLDAPVRVPREASEIVFGDIVAKIV